MRGYECADLSIHLPSQSHSTYLDPLSKLPLDPPFNPPSQPHSTHFLNPTECTASLHSTQPTYPPTFPTPLPTTPHPPSTQAKKCVNSTTFSTQNPPSWSLYAWCMTRTFWVTRKVSNAIPNDPTMLVL